MITFVRQLNKMTTRRVVFSISNFLEDLNNCFVHERPDRIDDVVQRYKDFLSSSGYGVKNTTKNYINKHPLVLRNEELKSYTDACHRLFF